MKRQDGDKSESSAKAQKLDDASSSDKPCEAEDKVAAVEVRYLSGDSHFIDGCSTVGDVMVHVAKQAGRFASEVAVTATDSGKILGHSDASPTLVSVILLEDVALSGDLLLANLLFYAGRGDCPTCFRLVSILKERGLLDRVLIRPVPDGEEVGVSPLISAARLGYADVVKSLLEAGADSDVEVNGQNESALIAASRQGYADVVAVLLEAGASVDCEVGGFFDSGTALEAAAEQGHKDVVVALLEAGASIDLHIGFHRGTALIAATEARQEDIVKLLLEKGAGADVANLNDLTPLIFASANGDVSIVELLLAARASVNGAEGGDQTPLMLAEEKGHNRVVEALLAAGAK